MKNRSINIKINPIEKKYEELSYECSDRDHLIGCMVGLAIGDAMGAPVEFMQRGTFNPVTDYRSGGKFRLNAGEWTDDTAMALCLAQSLIDCLRFNPYDQLEKYLEWMGCGYMSCSGKAIGIGKTVMRSLIKYRRHQKPYANTSHEKFSGNGSLMRLAPICIFYADDIDSAVHFAAFSSATTHASPIAIDACRYFSYLISNILQGVGKEEIFSYEFKKNLKRYFDGSPLHKSLDSIIDGEFKSKSRKGINSSGYVIHSLEAALWSFYTTDTCEDAILKAVNLGDDADTIGAITGQIAGAYYGLQAIPKKWVDNLQKSDLIMSIAKQLIEIK